MHYGWADLLILYRCFKIIQMTREDLKKKLDELQISEGEYSLFNELFSDRVILYQNYGDWEVFYLDERGRKNDHVIFKDESAAYGHILNLFVDSQKVKRDFNLN